MEHDNYGNIKTSCLHNYNVACSIKEEMMKLNLRHTLILGITVSVILEVVVNNHSTFASKARNCPYDSTMIFTENSIYCESDSASSVFYPIIFVFFLVASIAFIVFVIKRHRQNKKKP